MQFANNNIDDVNLNSILDLNPTRHVIANQKHIDNFKKPLANTIRVLIDIHMSGGVQIQTRLKVNIIKEGLQIMLVKKVE